MDLNKLGDPYQFSFARPILWLADGPGVMRG